MKVPEKTSTTLAEFKERDSLKRLWWIHDSFWHAALVRRLGPQEAGRINLEVNEKSFRMITNTLLRKKVIQRPNSIEDLMNIFRVIWKNVFFDDLYIHDPIEIQGDTAVWTGTRCHAYDSLKKAGMLAGYICGCQGLRNGVMKALHLKPLHEIKESLITGHGRCVVTVTFAPTDRPRSA